MTLTGPDGRELRGAVNGIKGVRFWSRESKAAARRLADERRDEFFRRLAPANGRQPRSPRKAWPGFERAGRHDDEESTRRASAFARARRAIPANVTSRAPLSLFQGSESRSVGASMNGPSLLAPASR
jgi:hypothetical protein